MTFEEKAEIVFSQLRADRDRLQNAINKIRAEIEKSLYFECSDNSYDKGHNDATKRALEIIDKHIRGDADSHCDDCVLLKICEKNDPSCTFREKYNPRSVLEDILAENGGDADETVNNSDHSI